MKKRMLQVATAILGAVPVITGIVGMFGLSDPLYASAGLPESPLLDSNLRFLSAIWLGLGIAVFWLIPRIEQQTVLFRVLWGMIFLGGLGRLMSMFFAGLPPLPFVAFTVLEIVGAPLFIVWQAQVARANG
ncbi:MAG: DUF4345 domain-containing protein [Pseudomonadota bacterium]